MTSTTRQDTKNLVQRRCTSNQFDCNQSPTRKDVPGNQSQKIDVTKYKLQKISQLLTREDVSYHRLEKTQLRDEKINI